MRDDGGPVLHDHEPDVRQVFRRLDVSFPIGRTVENGISAGDLEARTSHLHLELGVRQAAVVHQPEP